jgi:hypothetical protein
MTLERPEERSSQRPRLSCETPNGLGGPGCSGLKGGTWEPSVTKN